MLNYISGLLSDLILSRIAAKLGVEWNMVALELRLTQQQIEHIQMDNSQYNTHKHIVLALIKCVPVFLHLYKIV